MKNVRTIREIIAIQEGKEDTNYTLVRNAAGEISVEIYYSPNKPFVCGRPGPTILPGDFDKHIIDGKSLREHVEMAVAKADGISEVLAWARKKQSGGKS
jgi:hypothetical protein